MKINIQSLPFRANTKLINFTEDKISKLGQYSDQIIQVEVMLKVGKNDVKNNKTCDIKLVIPGNDLFASKKCNSLEGAILKSSEALKQQLLTWKEKNEWIEERQNS
jgi:ribosomal subunit interface protein